MDHELNQKGPIDSGGPLRAVHAGAEFPWDGRMFAMWERRSVLKAACLLGLGCGGIPVLSGCGDSGSDTDTVKLSTEQKEEEGRGSESDGGGLQRGPEA